ncbi:MAG: polysaccharide pyruvyl transferase family protein [Candidatus Aenigmatarchaeota archaeon]
MVFETCKKIKELDKYCQIFLFSPNREYDEHFLKRVSNPYNIRVCGYHQDRLFLKYLNMIHDLFIIVLFSLLKPFSIKRIPFRGSLPRTFMDVDVILEIAGISFTDNLGLRNAINSAFRMLSAKILERKYLCLPQSYGPSSNLLIRILAKIGLNTTAHIMPRGHMSIKFLKEIGVNSSRMTFVPDLAFSYENPDKYYRENVYKRLRISSSHKYIAVLPNVHLYRWLGDKILEILKAVIDNLITLDYTVILIPHELSGDAKTLDDKFICDLLHKKVKNKEKVILISDELTANEIKSLIALCDFVIASRYHAMISALKMKVPPIVIGWANKYHETMELFSLTDFVIKYNTLNEVELINKIYLLLHERNIIIEKIQREVTKYERASEIFKEILRNEIYEKHQ